MKHSAGLGVVMLLAGAAVGCGSSGASKPGGPPVGGHGGGGGAGTSTGGAGGERPGSGGVSGTGGGTAAGGAGAGGAGAGGSVPGDAAPPVSDAVTTDALAAEAPPASTGPFKHPGLLWNREHLQLIRTRVAAGSQPWKAAYDKAMGRFGSLGYNPQPFAVVECGSYSNPNNGCSEERNDAVAAYTHALAWQVTGNAAHAQKAIAIMNAWAGRLTGHSNSNAPLQAGWGGALWPLSAEIVRHTYDGWAAPEVAAFAKMLKDVYLPATIKGSGSNGNWELVMIEASLKIAVFLDDRPTFDKALAMARKRIPAYFYLKSDGPTPVPPPSGGANLVSFWHGQTMLVDGLAQETCRDFLHTQYGISSSLAIAEVAFQQGVDLYQEMSERLRATMEFHADYILGKAVPAWLCGGNLSLSVAPTWEIGFNHFHDRLGLALPLTQRLIETRVRAGSGVDHHMIWETLTHAGAGWVGLR